MKVRLIDVIDENTPVGLSEAEVRIVVRPRAAGPLAATVNPPSVQFTGIAGEYRGRGSSEIGYLRVRADQARLVESKLNAGDEAKFLRKLREDVLSAATHPYIRFTCESVATVPPEGWRGGPGPNPRYVLDPNAPLGPDTEDLAISGRLEILGRSRTLGLRLHQRYRSIFSCELELDLRDFGIKPPQAFMGALRVDPKLPVSIEVDLRAALQVSERDFGASTEDPFA